MCVADFLLGLRSPLWLATTPLGVNPESLLEDQEGLSRFLFLEAPARKN